MRKRLFFATLLMALWLISTTLSEANQKRRYFPNQIENNKFGSNILLEGSPKQIARFENLLDRISEVPKGYETIRTISDSGHELTIRHAKYVVLSAGRTLAPMSRKLINGKGDDVTILFSAHIPDSGSHMVYNAQNKLIEFTAIQNLFHELAHAMHMMKGSWRYFASEKQAIEEENVFRRDLAMIRHTPITERYKKTGVLINNTDDIFVLSEWFGPSIIKKPEPGEYAEDGQQTTSGTGIKTSLGIQRRK